MKQTATLINVGRGALVDIPRFGPTDTPIRIRVGINAGEPIAEDDDLYGSDQQHAPHAEHDRPDPSARPVPAGVTRSLREIGIEIPLRRESPGGVVAHAHSLERPGRGASKIRSEDGQRQLEDGTSRMPARDLQHGCVLSVSGKASSQTFRKPCACRTCFSAAQPRTMPSSCDSSSTTVRAPNVPAEGEASRLVDAPPPRYAQRTVHSTRVAIVLVVAFAFVTACGGPDSAAA